MQDKLLNEIDEDDIILDIGPKTIELFDSIIKGPKYIFWNGPMGVFEFNQYSKGTKIIAEQLSKLKDAVTIVGGGSTAEFVRALNFHETMTHVSTGGGATLEFLGGKTLPGIAKLNGKDTELDRFSWNTRANPSK
mgnify:CR=1 FL=1